MTILLNTDQNLLERLQAAAKRAIELPEERRQRISMMYSNLPREAQMTRQQLEREISEEAA